MKFKLIYLREGNRIEDFDALDAISSEIEGIDWASGDYKVIDDEGNEYGADWVERPAGSPSFGGIKVVTIGKYRLVKDILNNPPEVASGLCSSEPQIRHYSKKKMNTFWTDKTAILTTLVGVGLMLLTLIWHINSAEGSVMPRFLTGNAIGAAVICVLLATCMLVWIPTVSLVTFIPVSEHAQYVIACGIMLILQCLLYFMIGQLISLCARKLTNSKSYGNGAVQILFLLTSSMLLVSCSHTGMFGNAPAKVRLERIGLSKDNARFVRVDSGAPFVIWGVNYDHDGAGRLLEDYWREEWPTVVEDFKEIKALGANVVRIHLQTAKFITNEQKPDEAALKQLARLVDLAEETGLYLDITGLACYRKKDVPQWYTKMSEQQRWEIQSIFWSAVAKTCAKSPAVFCYDLMNEPVMAGAKGETDWLAGEFAGSCFVQRITLDLAGRTREQVAKAWIDKLVTAIRQQDKHHLITVGVIPWAMVWPTAKPFFHSKEVGENLDFVSVHFYPEKGKVDKALAALAVYDIGKPLVIEEMFPLACGSKELEAFIDGSRPIAEGWISFYWGKTIGEYAEDRTIAGAITKEWLEHFKAKAPEMLGTLHLKDPKKR